MLSNGASTSDLRPVPHNELSNYIDILPEDVLIEIGVNLSYEDITQFCRTYSRINKTIGINDTFLEI
jgi:hypothetical protein